MRIPEDFESSSNLVHERHFIGWLDWQRASHLRYWDKGFQIQEGIASLEQYDTHWRIG